MMSLGRRVDVRQACRPVLTIFGGVRAIPARVYANDTVDTLYPAFVMNRARCSGPARVSHKRRRGHLNEARGRSSINWHEGLPAIEHPNIGTGPTRCQCRSDQRQPDAIIGNGVDTAVVTAVVLDAFGNPVPDGAMVSLLASSGTFPAEETASLLTVNGLIRVQLTSAVVSPDCYCSITATTVGAQSQGVRGGNSPLLPGSCLWVSGFSLHRPAGQGRRHRER
jgi:hypothetical protein